MKDIFIGASTIPGARFPYRFHMTGFAQARGEAKRVAEWCTDQVGLEGILWEISPLGDFHFADEAHACAFKMMWL